MAKQSMVSDGRDQIVYLLEKFTEAKGESAGVVNVGDIYFIKAMAAEASGFGTDIDINSVKGRGLIATKKITMVEGDVADVFKKEELELLGFATSKDHSESKETADSTVDYDRSTNSKLVGVVSVEGTISGYGMTESLKHKGSALNSIKANFTPILEVDGEGKISALEAHLASNNLLAFYKNIRSAEDGDLVEVRIEPVVITQNSQSSDYQSTQEFSLNYQGASDDGFGHTRNIVQVPYSKDIVPNLDRPAVVA